MLFVKTFHSSPPATILLENRPKRVGNQNNAELLRPKSLNSASGFDFIDFSAVTDFIINPKNLPKILKLFMNEALRHFPTDSSQLIEI
jgi:hypothetical protein